MDSTQPAIQNGQHQEINEFESRIDNLHLSLQLLRYPKNLAIWSLVTNGLERLYQPQNSQVPERDRTLQIVLSRSLGVVLRRLADHPFKGHVAIKNLGLVAGVREAAVEANAYARFWLAATGYFPEWHQKEAEAVIISPNSIRFGLLSSERERRVSAYQKSFRPALTRALAETVYAPIPEWAKTAYSRALDAGTTQDRRLLYRIPQAVYEYYRDWYAQKMTEAVEHPTETDLGAYDIGDAIRFWSALASIASVHDYLCYVAGVRFRLPVNSLLPVRKREVWTEELAQLSGLPISKCDAILEHITCHLHSVIDLHVTPFLPMDEKTAWLALAAPLAISGRFDQNLLRICSANDPARFNRITPDKEKRLRRELFQEVGPLHIRCLGPFSLPSPLPDVDLVLEDANDDTLVIAELKWVRQPIGWKSRHRAEEELRRGLKQLCLVRDFLNNQPNHLVSRSGGISKPISRFKNVFYAVFTRGHLITVTPQPEESMIPLDALKYALESRRHLASAMTWLLTDSWLPREGVDFRIQESHFAFREYSIEAPVFTPM
jgi:hypothetical protein